MSAPACRFCRILEGGEPALRVFEDRVSTAFLDRRPLFPGHCLLVPRGHYPTLADLPDRLVGSLFRNARRLAVAVERAMGAGGTFVALNNRVSQSVPHLHVHVVPRRRGDGLRGFFWPRHPYPDEAAARAAQEAILAALAQGEADGDGG